MAIDGIQREELSVAARIEDGVIHVEASGEVAMQSPQPLLDPFWTAVDAEAVASGCREVNVDLRQLTFMNSSGILTLVRWITRARKHDDATAYKIRFRIDANSSWQKNGLPTIARLAPARVELVS